MALLPTIRLPDLQAVRAIVDKDGRANPEFLTWLNGANRNIRSALIQLVEFLEDIVELNDLITAANTAIENVNNAAEAVKAESSLNNSYVGNFTAPLISADSAGNITIASHDRIYGDSVLNPTVAVTGAVVASGQAPGETVYIGYSDPTRAGGSVTYQWSLVETDFAQTGDMHSVGAATIPAAGTVDGGYVRPPGFPRSAEF